MEPDQETQEQALRYKVVLRRAMTDQEFRKRFIGEPAVVLRENGIDVPRDVDLQVVENNDNTVHLVVPELPAHELSEADLDRIAAGVESAPFSLGWLASSLPGSKLFRLVQSGALEPKLPDGD